MLYTERAIQWPNGPVVPHDPYQPSHGEMRADIRRPRRAYQAQRAWYDSPPSPTRSFQSAVPQSDWPRRYESDDRRYSTSRYKPPSYNETHPYPAQAAFIPPGKMWPMMAPSKKPKPPVNPGFRGHGLARGGDRPPMMPTYPSFGPPAYKQPASKRKKGRRSMSDSHATWSIPPFSNAP